MEADIPINEERTGRIERLYEEHAPHAGRLAYLLTADRELAQDIAQEAFVNVVARLSSLTNPDAFGAYL